MSRIGKKPINLIDNVTVQVNGSEVTVKGPKGELKMNLRPEVTVKQEEGVINVELVQETKESPAYWGLTRALISNMIEGVTEGFKKELELVGVGYRAKSSGKGVELSIGFSHPVNFEAPEGITIEVPDQKKITVSGIDKQLVGLTAAQIRAVRKPEPYKGKGIKYVDEVILRKAGKAGKA